MNFLPFSEAFIVSLAAWQWRRAGSGGVSSRDLSSEDGESIWNQPQASPAAQRLQVKKLDLWRSGLSFMSFLFPVFNNIWMTSVLQRSCRWSSRVQTEWSWSWSLKTWCWDPPELLRSMPWFDCSSKNSSRCSSSSSLPIIRAFISTFQAVDCLSDTLPEQSFSSNCVSLNTSRARATWWLWRALWRTTRVCWASLKEMSSGCCPWRDSREVS